MRKFALVLASLALAACQPGVVVVPPVSPGMASNALCSGSSLTAGTLADEKALYAAEALYNVPAHAYVTADANGKLTPALKARAKPLLQQAYSALKLVRYAYSAGDAKGFNCQYAALANFANQAVAILPRAN